MKVKKLIEVALPLDRINEACVREKFIRHGHPSTLHYWWARRPLAAARAVIWASLVDDPSSHPELFPTEEAQSAERQRLFHLLEQLVCWETSNDKDLLELAKTEIVKSVGPNPIDFLDPFAGGGALPLEAGRLGLNTHAHDLNPVPVLINKSMIEFPILFAGHRAVNPEAEVGHIQNNDAWEGTEGLADDVQYYGDMLINKAYEQLHEVYPTIKKKSGAHTKEQPVVAWLWARTVKCPNPACGCHMPLLKSSIIFKKHVFVEIEKGEDNWPVFKVKQGVPEKDEGTVCRKGAHCAFCGAPVSFSYIRDEGKAGRMSARMMAIVAKGDKGREYYSPTEEQEIAARAFEKEDLELGNIANYPGYLNPPAYGLDTFESLFTDRQLYFLNKLCEILDGIAQEVEHDAIKAGMKDDHLGLGKNGYGALAYSQLIKVYLSFVIDKIADYHTSICSWHNSGEKMRNTFGLTGVSMSWDYAEANPFSGATGCIENMLEWVVKSVRNLPVINSGVALQRDAQSTCNLHDIMISTDPPYYSNVPYADFADFFYVWLRRNLHDVFPELFKTMLTPKAEELVADPYRCGGKSAAADYFENGMLLACQKMFEMASENIPVTIYYAFKESDTKNNQSASTGWETMLTAIIKAGFSIVGTWPIRTEMTTRSRGQGANALASSIVLVCRKRSVDAPQTTRRNLVNALRRELRPALKKLQESNIAPVDLAQSAIGPGMGVFSQYRRVLEADGTEMTVRSALQVINEEIDLYFNEQVGSMDMASRFCVDLYTQSAYNDIQYGVAEVLANAKGASIPLMADQGVLYAKAGNVHLVERNELPVKVSASENNIWLLTQQLTRAMANGGIEACAEIVFSMYGSNTENAKDLAYRLYTIAERKGWTEEAYAYNTLVVAWPDIQNRAADMKAEVPEQLTIFDEN